MRESVLWSHFCQCAWRTESACVYFPEKLKGPEVSNFFKLGWPLFRWTKLSSTVEFSCKIWSGSLLSFLVRLSTDAQTCEYSCLRILPMPRYSGVLVFFFKYCGVLFFQNWQLFNSLLCRKWGSLSLFSRWKTHFNLKCDWCAGLTIYKQHCAFSRVDGDVLWRRRNRAIIPINISLALLLWSFLSYKLLFKKFCPGSNLSSLFYHNVPLCWDYWTKQKLLNVRHWDCLIGGARELLWELMSNP